MLPKRAVTTTCVSLTVQRSTTKLSTTLARPARVDRHVLTIQQLQHIRIAEQHLTTVPFICPYWFPIEASPYD